MVMPSTSTSFDCSSSRIACIFEPAGPNASWSMTTLRRGVASAARQSTVAPSITSAVMTSSVQTAAAPNQVFGVRGDGRSTTVSRGSGPERVDYHSRAEARPHRLCCDIHARPAKIPHRAHAATATLSPRHHLELAAAAENVDSHGVRVALEGKIDGGIAHSEVAELHARQRLRECRVSQVDSRLPCPDGETETGLQQEKAGAGGPGLRGAGDGIERRCLARTPSEATDQLREAVQLQKHRQIEHPREDSQR